MNIIKFTCAALPLGKQGIVAPDENGYYTLILGGLNCFNSANQYYVYEGAAELFKESSSFMRRIRAGKLYGECGHPKKLPGMTDDEYVSRILTIYEDNVSHHISDVWLDMEYGKNNPQYGNNSLIAIMGKVKPAGPKGKFLKDSLENPKENVCFSIRSFTDNTYDGRTTKKTLVKIESFDLVIEQGIFIAEKYKTPTLECFVEKAISYNNLVEADKITEMSLESAKNSITELKRILAPRNVHKINTINW